MSNNANAAKMIRQELKQAFPTVKFSVRSDYSSVNISWTDGVPSDLVKKIADKYQYGHFNGMEDIYEVSNRRDDIPQVQFVFCNRDISETIFQNLFEQLKKKYAHCDQLQSLDQDCKTLQEKWGSWNARQLIRRFIYENKTQMAHEITL